MPNDNVKCNFVSVTFIIGSTYENGHIDHSIVSVIKVILREGGGY